MQQAVFEGQNSDGALLRHLARARPDCRFVGIEHAPLPWCWAWLSARSIGNLEIRLGDFWTHSLEGYAVVHAYLSPAAMPRLAAKAGDEMRPGARLVSEDAETEGFQAMDELERALGAASASARTSMSCRAVPRSTPRRTGSVPA